MALDKLGGNSFSTGAIANSLGYTPLGNTSGDITSTLGYVPLGNTSGSITSTLGYTPANKAGDSFTGNISTSGTISGSMPQLFQSVSNVTTDANRTLGGGSGWVNHLSTTITVTKYNPVFCSVNFAMTYESDAVRGEARFQLVGPATYTSESMSVAQQSDVNRARGAHSANWMFGNVTPGSYTVYLQVNNTNGGTWILNNYLGFDSLRVHYS